MESQLLKRSKEKKGPTLISVLGVCLIEVSVRLQSRMYNLVVSMVLL